MKRIAFLFIIVFAFGSLIGCQSSPTLSDSITTDATTSLANPIESAHLDLIYEVDGAYSGNIANSISSTPVQSISDSAEREITLEYLGLTRPLSYNSTLYYPIGGETVHQYLVDDNLNGGILLNQDGSIHSLLFKFATLNISKTDSPEQILPLLKAELQKWVDLDQYTYIELPEPNDDTEGFSIYNFRFTNQTEGYVTDYVMVAVDSSGAVFGCKIRNLPIDIVSLNIDKNLEQEYIELKMKEIYSTSDHQEYVENSFKECYTPHITMYNNELYVEYFVSATLISKQSGDEISSYIHTILIPLKLLTAETVPSTQ